MLELSIPLSQFHSIWMQASVILFKTSKLRFSIYRRLGIIVLADLSGHLFYSRACSTENQIYGTFTWNVNSVHFVHFWRSWLVLFAEGARYIVEGWRSYHCRFHTDAASDELSDIDHMSHSQNSALVTAFVFLCCKGNTTRTKMRWLRSTIKLLH